MKIINYLLLYLFKLGWSRKRPFEGSYENLNNFRYSYPFGRTLMKAEQQYYSDNNVTKYLMNYEFKIKKEHVFAKPQWNKPEMDFDYTSGMIWSNETFLHGKFEADIYIPNGYGLWSAFWLFGGIKDPEKRFGEIDIFEYYGKEKKFTYNTHFGTDYEHNQSKGSHGIKMSKLENTWHKYGLKWGKKYLKIYIDEKLVGIRSAKGCDVPMNLIINMAIQKNIGNKLDKSLPTKMLIENIKYYENC